MVKELEKTKGRIIVELKPISDNIFDIDFSKVKHYFKYSLKETIKHALEEIFQDENFHKEIREYTNKVILSQLKKIEKKK